MSLQRRRRAGFPVFIDKVSKRIHQATLGKAFHVYGTVLDVFIAYKNVKRRSQLSTFSFVRNVVVPAADTSDIPRPQLSRGSMKDSRSFKDALLGIKVYEEERMFIDGESPHDHLGVDIGSDSDFASERVVKSLPIGAKTLDIPGGLCNPIVSVPQDSTSMANKNEVVVFADNKLRAKRGRSIPGKFRCDIFNLRIHESSPNFDLRCNSDTEAVNTLELSKSLAIKFKAAYVIVNLRLADLERDVSVPC
ncbi:hypothetical protein V6N12_024538 [Hibiscus sabdariffa]|uniref:Uncharacterized protein n=1 Tax=Hibiscus sabdariffa TaxID=183260 RepID=A0ABR2G0V8_9ROSI